MGSLLKRVRIVTSFTPNRINLSSPLDAADNSQSFFPDWLRFEVAVCAKQFHIVFWNTFSYCYADGGYYITATSMLFIGTCDCLFKPVLFWSSRAFVLSFWWNIFAVQPYVVNHWSDSNLYPITTTATRHRTFDRPTRSKMIDGAVSISRYRWHPDPAAARWDCCINLHLR